MLNAQHACHFKLVTLTTLDKINWVPVELQACFSLAKGALIGACLCVRAQYQPV